MAELHEAWPVALEAPLLEGAHAHPEQLCGIAFLHESRHGVWMSQDACRSAYRLVGALGRVPVYRWLLLATAEPPNSRAVAKGAIGAFTTLPCAAARFRLLTRCLHRSASPESPE